MTAKARHGLRTYMAAFFATVIAGSLLITAGRAQAETSITLTQGANMTVTAPADSTRIAFDLAGQIWLQKDRNKPAALLTKSGLWHQRPAFSRDGRLVAYEALQSGHRQIFVTDVDSGQTRQITFGPYDHLAPAWRPGGPPHSRLAMSSNRGGDFEIWEVDIDSLILRQLTFTAGNARDPAWNDDGTRLAYVMESASGSTLYILLPGEMPQRVLQEKERIVAPAWRPDGGLLTYTRLGSQSSQLRMLILSSPPITKPISHHEEVSPRPVHWLDHKNFLYAADGKIRRRTLGLPVFDDIPFSVMIEIHRDIRSTRDASIRNLDNRPVRGSDGQSERADRHIAAALGDLWEFGQTDEGKLKLVRQLTNDAYVDSQPAFSPDGQRLAFISDRSGNRQVWIMDHASLDIRRLTHGTQAVGPLAWSPDGKSIAYAIADPGHGYRLQLTDTRSLRTQALPATSLVPGKPRFAEGAWTIAAGPESGRNLRVNDRQSSLPLSWRPASAGERYIVRAGRIFDGIGPGYLARQEIVIEGNLIVAIRPWSDAEPDTPIVDAGALTVIPGLIDLATRQEAVNEERTGRKWLAAGVTTIRQTVTDLDRATERLESWNSGRRIGPRLMMTVRPCHGVSGRPDKALLDRVMEQAAALNIVAIELCPDPGGQRLTDVIERAHAQGLAIIATTPTPGTMFGADELLPTNKVESDPALWRDFLFAAASAGVSIPSRFTAASGSGSKARRIERLGSAWQFRALFTATERRHFRSVWRENRTRQADVPGLDPNRILGAGGSILLGSEAPLTPQGLGLHAEMRRLAANSIQPFQVLKMAGLDAARALGKGESLGLIRVGRLADLVIVDGDPLANIEAALNVAGAIVNGRYYSRKDLTTSGLRGQSVGKLYKSASN